MRGLFEPWRIISRAARQRGDHARASGLHLRTFSGAVRGARRGFGPIR
jgi:hypothetical protein